MNSDRQLEIPLAGRPIMTSPVETLLGELDKKIADKTNYWRADALRKIIDLFIAGAANYDSGQISVFDAVISRLITKNMDRKLVIDISNRLAVIDNAPRGAISFLAQHADSAVYGPILLHARDICDQILIAIANRHPTDQKKLKHVADRMHLSEAVTDILINRGDKPVRRKIANNPSAAITESGFAMLVASMGGDKDMAVAIAARSDLPPELRPWLDEAINKK
jgi:uncharacterized protein (DUF2336 family)